MNPDVGLYRMLKRGLDATGDNVEEVLGLSSQVRAERLEQRGKRLDAIAGQA